VVLTVGGHRETDELHREVEDDPRYALCGSARMEIEPTLS